MTRRYRKLRSFERKLKIKRDKERDRMIMIE
jgi:hypothetical protein